MSNSSAGLAMKLLILAVGCFFLVTGILGIVSYDNSGGARFLAKITGSTDQRALNLVVAIVQLVMGIFLILELFSLLDFKAMSFVKVVFFILWAIFLAMTYFINKNSFLEPDFLTWLSRFSRDLIILASLWLIAQNNNA